MTRRLRDRITLTLFCVVIAYAASWLGVQFAKADVYVWTLAG